MPFHPPLAVAYDRLSEPGERDRLDRHSGFLAHFTRNGFIERLSDLDHAAGQGVEAVSWRAGAAHHKYLAVADDGGAHGEKGPLGIGSGVRHGNCAPEALCEARGLVRYG